jgi:O-antigen/teichoic acid export membrane protein
MLGGPLRIFALAFTLYYLGGLLMTLLLSLEKSRKVFISQLASAVGGILLGVPSTLLLGLTGACLGVFSIHFIRACAGGLLLYRMYASDPAAKGSVTAQP